MPPSNRSSTAVCLALALALPPARARLHGLAAAHRTLGPPNTIGATHETVEAVAPPGCVHVERFVVENKCDDELILQGWSQRVPAGEEVNITGQRHSDLMRLSWRLAHGPWDYDYLEVNGPFRGAPQDLCAHPNYATWFGFTTSSRFEALDPQTGAPACADAGAEVQFSKATCPTKSSDRFACDFHATPENLKDCSSPAATYQKKHTFAVNGDGSRTPLYSCAPGQIGEWCGVSANYPCDPGARSWFGWRVASWLDCCERRKSIVFKLTVCV